MGAIIVSGFPGVGKTYFQQNYNGNVLDSDSSRFAWIADGAGRKRNPEFPMNYIEHIESNRASAEYIFVSTHKSVRDLLVKRGLLFVLVFPTTWCKDEYLQRYKDRKSPEAWIKLLDENWDNWLEEVHCQRGCLQKILCQGEFIDTAMFGLRGVYCNWLLESGYVNG